ncbi:hypothetical protein [Spirosoma koreense]
MNTTKEYNPPTKPSPGRIVVFKLIGVLFSVLLLCFVEILLRLFQYGYDTRLFIDYPEDKNYLILNPDASKKYFTNQRIATTGNVEVFKKKKDPATLRIFVLGESTTIGYPYFHNGSFHRWLQYRLMHTFPDRNFEIVNLALTAVNSYTTRGFAKELIDYEPDVVLIYTGHNEYYGALGVGSTETIGGSPNLVNLLLYLRQFRMVQLMTNIYEGIQTAVTPKAQRSGGTRMKLMVADQQIPYGSDLYQRGVEQFHSNMDQTLATLSEHNIPVFISNLVSNEKDLPPFVSFSVDSLKFPAFKTNYTLGIKAFSDKKFSEAYRYFKLADQAFNRHALCTYYLGKTAYLLGDYGQAKTYFSKARDLDGLRFRAPESLNEILKQLCQKYKGTFLVDTKAIFEASSVHNIIGDELILEHVHPNLSGYALLSDAFYEALKHQKIVAVDKSSEISFAQLVQRMPLTKIDSLAGQYKVANLKRNWPFSTVMQADTFAVTSEEEKIAYALTFQQLPWPDATGQLYDFYLNHHEPEKARKTVEALVLEYPTDARYSEKTAMLSGETKDTEDAIFYFKKAFALAPTFEKARYLFVLYLQLDRPSEAMPYLDYAIQHNSSQFGLSPVKAYAEQVIDLKKTLAHDPTNVPVLAQIAQAYYRMDNKEVAAAYLKKIITIDAGNKDARALLSRIN